MIKRNKLFLSSTNYDLDIIRPEIIGLLGSHFDLIYHESADFQITENAHSHDICISKVAECDLLLLIIFKRYGGIYAGQKYPEYKDRSVTWAEVAEAYSKGIHVISFVQRNTFNERATFNINKRDSYKPKYAESTKIFDFISFITTQPKNNWIILFDSIADLKIQIKEKLIKDYRYRDFIAACDHQVQHEIASTVGKKYIPTLYTSRPTDENLSRFLYPTDVIKNLERFVQSQKDFIRNTKYDTVTKFLADKEHEKALVSFREIIDSHAEYDNIVFSSDSDKTNFIVSYNDVKKAYLFYDSHYLVIVDKAGKGKTNFCCHHALDRTYTAPKLFVSGRLRIHNLFSIEEYIRSSLSMQGFQLGQNVVSDLNDLLSSADLPLVIFLDAINENKDLESMNLALSSFIERIKGNIIKVIITCRDIYWKFFDTYTWTHNKEYNECNIDYFSDSNNEEIISKYFVHYKIRAFLSTEVKTKLANPLMLRFFCETYGNTNADHEKDLGAFTDIRYTDLFETYLNSKIKGLCLKGKQRSFTGNDYYNFLDKIARHIYDTKSRFVELDSIPQITGIADIDSEDSIYIRLLDEDIVITEDLQDARTKISTFIFDEFMEFIIARTLLRDIHARQAAYTLTEDLVSGIEQFKHNREILGYISIMLAERKGYSVWANILNSFKASDIFVIENISKLSGTCILESEIGILRQLLFDARASWMDACTLLVKLLFQSDIPPHSASSISKIMLGIIQGNTDYPVTRRIFLFHSLLRADKEPSTFDLINKARKMSILWVDPYPPQFFIEELKNELGLNIHFHTLFSDPMVNVEAANLKIVVYDPCSTYIDEDIMLNYRLNMNKNGGYVFIYTAREILIYNKNCVDYVEIKSSEVEHFLQVLLAALLSIVIGDKSVDDFYHLSDVST